MYVYTHIPQYYSGRLPMETGSVSSLILQILNVAAGACNTPRMRSIKSTNLLLLHNFLYPSLPLVAAVSSEQNVLHLSVSRSLLTVCPLFCCWLLPPSVARWLPNALRPAGARLALLLVPQLSPVLSPYTGQVNPHPSP